jgi:hypothetical protein
MTLCKGLILSGGPCMRRVSLNNPFCFIHANQTKTAKPECVVERISTEDINECINGKKGKLIGKGEQGSIYEFNKLVIKVTVLKNKIEESAWLHEACIGKELGELKIAPKIFRYLICGTNGVIIMQRLTTLKSKKVNAKKYVKNMMQKNTSNIVRYKLPNDESIDDLRNIKVKDQLGFISVLEKMIDRGYLHMDNHIENIGFINNRPIIFDFGFIQKRKHIDKRWALCFSLFIFLEKCPVTIVEQTQFYRVATACINDTYVWGNPQSGNAIPLKDLHNTEKEMTFLKHITKESIHEASPDLKVGSLAYAKIMNQDNRKGAILDYIYLIRNPHEINDQDVSKSVRELFSKQVQYVQKSL